MCLTSLPDELHVLIIEYFDDAVDIFHFQLMCKKTNDVVNNAGVVIWKPRLLDLCDRNSLFYPTFKINSATGQDLRHAVTAELKLSAAYARALGTPSPGISMSSRTLEVPHLKKVLDDEGGEIHDTWLIPGDQYVVLARSNLIEILDISGSTTKSAYRVRVLSTGALQIHYRGVVSRDRFRMVYRTAATESMESAFQGDARVKSTYVYLEFKVLEDGGFQINEPVPTLPLRLHATSKSTTVIGDNILFLCGRTSIFWRPKENKVSRWSVWGNTMGTPQTQVFGNDNYVAYINEKRVYIANVSLVALEDDSDIVDHPYYYRLPLMPTKKFFHKPSGGDGLRRQLTLALPLAEMRDEVEQRLIYDVAEFIDPEEDSESDENRSTNASYEMEYDRDFEFTAKDLEYLEEEEDNLHGTADVLGRVRRYELIFLRDDHGQIQVSKTLISTRFITSQDQDTQPPLPGSLQLGEHGLATLWLSDTGVHSITYGKADASGDLVLAPLRTSQPDHEGAAFSSGELCASSARILEVWRASEGDESENGDKVSLVLHELL